MKRLAALLAMAVAMCVCCSCNKTPATKYNENPDLSKKIVGSKNANGVYYREPETMEELLVGSEVVIMGRVLDDGVEEVVNPYGAGEEAERIAKEQKELGLYHDMSVTISRVEVLEVLKGDLKVGDVIEYLQNGKPKVADIMTKVRKDEKLLMILQQSLDPARYSTTMAEASLFYVDGENRITSMSDVMICARYDDRKLDLLRGDLQAAA